MITRLINALNTLVIFEAGDLIPSLQKWKSEGRIFCVFDEGGRVVLA